MKKRKKKEEEDVERKKSCLGLLLDVSSPTIPLEAGLSLTLVHCTLLTLNYSLLALENLNGRKCHHFSGSPVPVLY